MKTLPSALVLGQSLLSVFLAVGILETSAAKVDMKAPDHKVGQSGHQSH